MTYDVNYMSICNAGETMKIGTGSTWLLWKDVLGYIASSSSEPVFITRDAQGVRHLVRLLSAHIHAIKGLSREWGIREENNP